MLFQAGLLMILEAAAIGFLVAMAFIPPVVKVAREKHLFDPPSERKVHKAAIPPLGGVAIFVAFLLSIILASHNLSFFPLRYFMAALLLLFFIGLKDDLITVPAWRRFGIQFLAVGIMVLLGNLKLDNLHGVFGIHQIPSYLSIPLTMFVMLAIINAFNLIDGIDGLASGLAIASGLVAGSWFFLAGHMQHAVISFALAGSLFAFFLFNVFGTTNKLFMGDTGSLVVGLIMGVLVVRFNQFNAGSPSLYDIQSAPSVSFALVAVPLIDTLRVMTMRIMAGRSPFSADRNHIHHRLLELFPTHLTVTLIMVASGTTLMGVSLLLNHLLANVTLQFMLIFLLGLTASFIPSWVLKYRKARQQAVSAKEAPALCETSKIRQLKIEEEDSGKLHVAR